MSVLAVFVLFFIFLCVRPTTIHPSSQDLRGLKLSMLRNFHYLKKLNKTPKNSAYFKQLAIRTVHTFPFHWMFLSVQIKARAPSGPRPPHYRGFTITLSHATLGRTPLNKWSAGRRDLYLTAHDIHKTQASMPAAGFEPAIPESDRPHTHALDRAANRTGDWYTGGSLKQTINFVYCNIHHGPFLIM